MREFKIRAVEGEQAHADQLHNMGQSIAQTLDGWELVSARIHPSMEVAILVVAPDGKVPDPTIVVAGLMQIAERYITR